MIKIRVDIVGGGLGGLSAAISLKEKDKDCTVVVHEKYKEIGYNHEGRRCGEAYSLEEEWKRWKPVGKSIFNRITWVETILGDKKYVIQRAPGTSFMLNRQEFICQWAREAKKLGVELVTNNKVKSVDDLDGEYIIDASGCPSSLKRELRIPLGITGTTYQQTLEDSNIFASDTVKIFFMDSVGYFWLFPRDPKKKEINLGIGTIGDFDLNLKETLETFKEEQHIQGKINYVLGGLIPAGLQKPLKHRHILFVGDAGVGTFPLSGQGIYRALLSGEIAGTCIATGHPERYPRMMDQLFIKWDVLGKTYFRINNVLHRINKKVALSFYQYYSGFWYSIQ